MSLAPTPSAPSTAANEALSRPRATSASASAGNRRGPGSGTSGDFASLLRGQSAPEDDAAVAGRDGTLAADDPGTASADDEDSHEVSAAESRKLPTKQQPGAEDLTPTLQAWTGPLAADAAGGPPRDAASRVGALARGLRHGAERPGSDRAEAPVVATSRPGPAAGTDTGASPADAGRPPAVAAPAASTTTEGTLPSLQAPGDATAAPAAPPIPPAAEAPAPLPEARATLEPTPGTPAFTEALGVQLSTWLEAGVQHAVLELHPEDLGPIDVRISMRDGDTRVELGAQVDSTRAALTDALPQLADALGDVGLSLSGGSVSDQAAGGFAQPGGAGDERRMFSSAASLARAFGRTERGLADAADLPPARRAAATRGLLDLYA